MSGHMNEHPSVSALVDVPVDVAPAAVVAVVDVPVVPVVLETVVVLEAVVVGAEVADVVDPPSSRQAVAHRPRPTRIALMLADTC